MGRICIVSANRKFFHASATAKSVIAPTPRGLNNQRQTLMSLGTILLIILILALLGALPSWPYSAGWGHYHSGGLGLIVVILVVLLATGRL